LKGRKKWWGEELDREYVRVREIERRLMEDRGEDRWGELGRVRKEFRKLMERTKRGHWIEYLEGLAEEGGYR